MTLPGGGSTNLGTVTGKVRIEYESSNVAKAVKDVTNFEGVLSSVGSSAAASAKDVDKASGSLSSFSRVVEKVGSKPLTNPAAGLGKRVENETGRATKALSNLQHAASKGSVVKSRIKVAPTRVELDQGAIDRTLRNGSLTNAVNIKTAIRISPSEVVVDQKAINAAVQGRHNDPIRLKMPVHIDPSDVTVNNGPLSKAVSEVNSQGQKTSATTGLAGTLPLLGKITAGAGAAAVGIGAVGIALTKGFSRLSSLDAARVKLSALGKDAKEIQSISKSSLAAVEGTAFGLEEAFATAADAINAGIKPGQQLDKYLQATANTAALADTSMQHLGVSFARAATNGKLTGEILQQLNDRQVPVLKLLAEEYDVTERKARQMVSNGEVDFDRFINAMSTTGGAAKAMGNTISGSFQNLGAAVSRLGAAFLAPLFGKENADDASVIAAAIQKVTDAISGLGKIVSDNQGAIITFWEVLGKGGLIAAKAFVTLVSFISDAMVKITEIIGDTTGWLSDAFAAVADFVGADGVAANVREFADSMHNLGAGLRENRDINMGNLNRGLDNGWAALNRWAEGARKAANGGEDLGEVSEDTGPKVVALKDALEELQIKTENAETAMMGSNEQFQKFLDMVKEKGGTDALLNTLTQIRSQFENGGRQVKEFADAVELFGDKSQDAGSRADALIDALQGLNLLPGGSALASYNEEFDRMTSYTSTLIDRIDTMGDSLANADGTLNLNSQNSRNLLSQIESIRREMLQLIAAGEATPEEAYQRTVAGLNQLLQGQAGISPAVAQKIIDTYLPKGAILESIKAQNPTEALESIFQDDPAKLDSVLKLLTTTDDILEQIVGPDGKLHIATVLDAEAPGSVPGPPTPGKPGFIGPVPGGWNHQPGAPGAPAAPAGTPVTPTNLIPTLTDGSGAPPYHPLAGPLQGSNLTEKQLSDLVALTNNEEALKKVLAENPDINAPLQAMVEQAERQGENLSVALARGIVEGDEHVKQALIELATLAGDYLGNSPAKYGPLSGKGWTLYRGKVFSQDWAKGIESASGEVAGAVSNTASAAVSGMSGSGFTAGGGTPIDAHITAMIKDLQEFSDLGKLMLDFGNQVADIAFSVVGLANDLSNGRLFPTSYVKDPNFDSRRGSALGPWNPTQNRNPLSSIKTNSKPGQIPLVQNPDGTWTSSDPEWAKLIKRESGGDPTTVQGVQDANSGGNEATGLFQIAKGTWAANGGLAYGPNAKDATPQQQAEIAAKIFNEQGGYPWGSGASQNHLNRESEELLRAGLTGGLPTVANGPLSTAANASGTYGLKPGSAISYGEEGFPDWVYQLADQFGLEASTYSGHQENGAGGHIASGPVASNPLGLNRGIDWRPKGLDWNSPEGAARMEALAVHLRDSGLAEQVIFENATTGSQIGFPFNSDYSANYPGHRDHLHTRFSAPVGLAPDGGFGLSLGQPGTTTALSDQTRALTGIWENTNGLPSMPSQLQDFVSQDPILSEAMRNQANLTEDSVVPVLQHLDGLIAEQNALGTPNSKLLAEGLGDYKSGLQGQFGLTAGASGIDQAQSIASGVSSIANDIFGIFDQGIKVIGATHNISGTLNRGIENTADINSLIDDVQEWITLFQRGWQTASDITGFAASLVSMGAGADPSGGAAAASAALGGASAITGIVSQVLGAWNAAIDIGQEIYSIATKHIGRFFLDWAGLSGSSDVKYLLDEYTGQIAAYSSENPENKRIFDTLGRSLGSSKYNDAVRNGPVNHLTIYQGPGQDPRDTMNDAMFAIKSSGVGAYGYAM